MATSHSKMDVPRNKIICGDVRDVLPTLPDGFVQCAVTSPPYWGLRDYGTAEWEGGNAKCDHLGPPKEDKQGELRTPYRDVCRKCGAVRKDRQLGLEATPEEYIEKMVGIFREVRRVLRDDGTLWLNMGDSFANDAKWGGSTGGKHVEALHGQSGIGRRKVITGLKPKDLCGIPWRLALALQADGWWLRCDIIWSKPNPMPESVTDRPTKSHEYVFLLTKAARYFYDAEAVREPLAPASFPRALRGVSDQNKHWNSGEGAPGSTAHTISRPRPNQRKKFEATHAGGGSSFTNGHSGYYGPEGQLLVNPAGRNKRSVWEIPTQNFRGAHFATFPEALVEPCIKAGASHKACPHCGSPWERVVERVGGPPQGDHRLRDGFDDNCKTAHASGTVAGVTSSDGAHRLSSLRKKICPECGGELVFSPNDGSGRCIVFDPFMGAGTVAVVAKRLSCDYLGVELNPDYIKMAEKRIGYQRMIA